MASGIVIGEPVAAWCARAQLQHQPTAKIFHLNIQVIPILNLLRLFTRVGNQYALNNPILRNLSYTDTRV